MTTTDTTSDLPDHHTLPWGSRRTAAAPEPPQPQDAPATIPMPPSYPPSVGTSRPETPADGQPADAPAEADEPDTTPEPEQRPWWSARRKPTSAEAPNDDDTEEDEPDPDSPAPQPAAGSPRQDRIAAAKVSWDAVPPKTRRLAYDASATAIGWGIGMVRWDAELLAGSHIAPAAYAATVLVLGAGAGTWALTRMLALPLRLCAVTLATTAAYGEGGEACQLMAAHAVDPTFAVPAVTAIGLITAGWWISRRTRHWWPPLAWLLRAPLGCALVAAAVYH
ncbi:hypothetical protein [Streptacidiphilus jiangxiensis]|uniref:Uncharacterized protein n=1 Tax=Streptacidiphilus jiangxiensis TaxID=235985 RepID=A0A1H8BIY5_STRJI|nr:hypothetical protein [Streptacidiphilus jiangxiensis]SEM82871.1 hypothetical protein SAMN05414137_1683 [Streptacidiphilus jiangxiensis]